MNTIIEKKKFNILGNLFLISFLFYYYFPMEFGVILYSILLFFVLAQFNIKLKPIDFVLISITGILLFYYVSTNAAPVFDIVNVVRFSLGIILFVFYFQNKVTFDATKLLYLLLISIYVEAILINTIINIYDMPNFPDESVGGNSHFTSTVATQYELGGGMGQSRVGFDTPIGFGGIRSVTANVLVLLLFISKTKLRSELIVLLTILFLGTGTGFLSFIIYAIIKKRYIYLIGIYLLPLLLIYEDSPFYKISPTYFEVLFNVKMGAIAGSYVDKTVYDFFVGVGQSDGSSDFAWLLILRSLGVIFLIIFIVWFFSKFSRFNMGPLLIVFIVTFHYPVLFSVPGQLIIGYIISRSFRKENYL